MSNPLRRALVGFERAMARRRRPRISAWPSESSRAAAITAEAIRHGWTSTTDASLADLLVAFEPPTVLRDLAIAERSVALITPGTESDWIKTAALDAADEVVVSSESSRRLLDAAWARDLATVVEGPCDSDVHVLDPGTVAASRVGIATCAPDWASAPSWGDTYFARALLRGFRRAGWTAKELVRHDWYGPHAERCDVVIHLRGLARRQPRRGQTNVLWIISHPERVTAAECDGYDVIAVASEPHAARLSGELGRPVHHVAQGADTDTFRLGHRESSLCDHVVSVGNARWPRRNAPRWLVRNGQPFRLTGSNWHGLPEATMLAEPFLANRDLNRLYRSAHVLVADHHGSMRTGGFIANRIYDALAAGGCVISDDVDGLEAVFGDVVPTYDGPEQLAAQLATLAEDPHRREQLSAEGRRLVLANHTLDHRVAELLALVTEPAPGRP